MYDAKMIDFRVSMVEVSKDLIIVQVTNLFLKSKPMLLLSPDRKGLSGDIGEIYNKEMMFSRFGLK